MCYYVGTTKGLNMSSGISKWRVCVFLENLPPAGIHRERKSGFLIFHDSNTQLLTRNEESTAHPSITNT